MKISKRMTAKDAVAKFINDGSNVMVGGFFHSISYTLTHEIIRQKKKGLTISTASFNEHADLLIGAGCVDRIDTSYIGMEVFGACESFRRSIEKGIPHKVELEEYSNFAMMARYMAGALGIPYMPVNSMKGSDMVKNAAWMGDNKVKLMKDPFGSGFEHVLVPALQPEIGYFHVQRADEEGNCQMWGIWGDAPWSERACKKVIVSCEEIVSREIIGRDCNRTILPGYKVVAVVHAPFGAHPKNCQGYYDVDRPFIRSYIKASKTVEGWKKFMDEWVYGVADRDEYLKKYINTFGMQEFLNLKARDFNSSSVNYGY
ncbi:MAG: 3-oxoadipate--succinyl-CoA transferase subunit A [Deltaproteobacteria bacterium HGW-Deltaproteobacteria-12]|nr:MAG: 3-oxoadipate--succinyl-CoA transferase subunit A [Deltaproteobacteria bacterium HGW-Deltaproteobacteria-12]